MKKLLFILLLLPVSLFGQYLQNDTTYLFTYEQARQLAKDRETRKRLEKEIEILVKIGVEKDIVISKLNTRDSLYNLEVAKCDQMNSILLSNMNRCSEMVDNYKELLISSESKLTEEINKRKDVEVWKNVYKFGIPAAVIATILLIR